MRQGPWLARPELFLSPPTLAFLRKEPCYRSLRPSHLWSRQQRCTSKSSSKPRELDLNGPESSPRKKVASISRLKHAWGWGVASEDWETMPPHALSWKRLFS